jgi:phage FluMu protein Com
MRRKTSTIPTKVFKYGLQSPTVNGRLVDETIYLAHKFYNKLIEITRTSRTAYRTERSRRFPELVVVETATARLTAAIKISRDKIKASKILGRKRAVDAEGASEVNRLCKAHKLLKTRLTELRTSCKSDPSFSEWTSSHNAATKASIAGARNSCGVAWGTYNLIVASVQQACRDATLDPEFKHYDGEGRIGVQIQGGMSVSDLATDTQLQIAMPDLHDGLTRGQWRRNSRTLVKMRVGSDDKHRPIWAEFPAIIHRLLPDDARIMGAVITRRRLGVFRRWSYELCISCESNKFNKTSSSPEQRGTAAVNFGWRQFGDGMRIATINNDVTGIEEVRLPTKITNRFTKCDDLRSIIDTQFNAIRATLTTWLNAHGSDAPEWLIESLKYLHLWKQPERLDRVVGNWAGLRFTSDADIFPLLAEWRTKWRHLTEWMMRNRRQGLDMRKDFYRTTAARIARHTSRLVIETFNISQVAVLPKPEEETTGGPKARHNRFLAAISELRRCLLLAASKYHCAVDIVAPTNNTRRCNVCGKLLAWDPAKEVMRDCPDCSTWDQDVNNTNNAMVRVASGEVVPMVVPAEVAKNGKITPSKTSTYKAARNELRNILISQ